MLNLADAILAQIRMIMRSREITEADFDPLVGLLTKAFTARTSEFWVRALQRLAYHNTPPGLPKYGYVLEADGDLVGVLLLICSALPGDYTGRRRCNVSAWYVEPRYRNCAALLVSRAFRHKDVTFYNITPDPPTFPILEAQGYVRYCTGRFLCAPLLSSRIRGARVRLFATGDLAAAELPPFERALLAEHADYGCLSVTCTWKGDTQGFVFLPLRKAGLVPYAYLAYCRELEEFRRFAAPLGGFLARRGYPLVVVDANRRIPGIFGKYFDGSPKYFRGPDQPRLGDIAYSERVLFGF